MAEQQEVYGDFACTHFADKDYQVGDGQGERAQFMDRDILKAIANQAIQDGIKANKASKCAQKIKVSVTNKGAFLTKESGGDMLYHIPGIVFHCLVMGKNSAWSKKQMAVLMSRITPEDGKPATHLKVHTIEFPKKKNAALMFKAFVKLMEYLRESQKGRTFSEQDNAENNHDAAPDNEDDEYLSIMTSGPL